MEENEVYYSTYTGVIQEFGTNNVYRENEIVGSIHSGIAIRRGTARIEGNDIENSQGEGIAILNESGAEIVDNTLKDNRIDICWSSTTTPSVDDMTLDDENDFETGGFSALCVVTSLPV